MEIVGDSNNWRDIPYRDRRLFMPVHRHSRTFRKAYKKRTSVERVNSRIAGLTASSATSSGAWKKMRLRVGLALTVMLATAATWIRAGQAENARSLVRTAA